MNFYIKKDRRIIGKTPITVMKKIRLSDKSDNSNLEIFHNTLGGLDQNDHPQYSLTADTLSLFNELSAYTKDEISRIYSAINDFSNPKGEVVREIINSSSFVLAGIEIAPTLPAPDDVLSYDSLNNLFVWRNINDLIGDISVPNSITSQIENNTNTINNFSVQFNSDYIKSKALHLTFNGPNSGVDPLNPNISHGIQWANHTDPILGFYGIDVGGYTGIGPFGDVDGSFGMRFTMDSNPGRGWAWTRVGPGFVPVASLSNEGQFAIRSGITFENIEPLINCKDNVSNSKHGYILVYDSGTSAMTLAQNAGSSGGGVTDHGNLVGLLDNDHPQYALTGTGVEFLDVTATTGTLYLGNTDGPHSIKIYDGIGYTVSFGWNDVDLVLSSSTDMKVNGYVSSSELYVSDFIYASSSEIAIGWTGGSSFPISLTGQVAILSGALIGTRVQLFNSLVPDLGSNRAASIDWYDSGGSIAYFIEVDDATSENILRLKSFSGTEYEYLQVWDRSTGNVGINERYPTETFTVCGNTLSRGKFYAGGSIYVNYEDLGNGDGAAPGSKIFFENSGTFEDYTIRVQSGQFFIEGGDLNLTHNIGVNNDVFVGVGSNPATTDSAIIFGSAFDKKLLWDASEQEFSFSDNLYVNGIISGISLCGSSLYVENDINVYEGSINLLTNTVSSSTSWANGINFAYQDIATGSIGWWGAYGISPTAVTYLYGGLSYDNAPLKVDLFNSRVGINLPSTNGPSYTLDVYGDARIHTDLNVSGNSTFNGTLISNRDNVEGEIRSDIFRRGLSIDMKNKVGPWSRGFVFYDNATLLGGFHAYGSVDGTSIDRLQIGQDYSISSGITIDMSNGFVGINKLNPQYPLHTSGSIFAENSLICNSYLDVGSVSYFRDNIYLRYDSGASNDGDSYLYFYENGSSQGAWLKWSDALGQFEFSGGPVEVSDLSVTNSVDITNDLSVHDHVEASALMIEFNSTDLWAGIQWGNSGDGIGKNVDGGQSIHVSSITNSGYNYGDVTSLSMRFTMDANPGRGWIWTRKGGSPTFKPVMSLSNNGQLFIDSGITFVSKEPFFGTSATTADAKNDYVFAYDSGASQVKLKSNVNSRTSAVSVMFDGGGSEISVGTVAWVSVPFNCKITEFVLLADQVGSISFDVQANSYVNYPPTVADSITATTAPIIASNISSSGLTDNWTNSINSGDIIQISATSVSTITKCLVSLTIVKDL